MKVESVHYGSEGTFVNTHPDNELHQHAVSVITRENVHTAAYYELRDLKYTAQAFEEVVNQENTALLRYEVTTHGATIDDNGIRRPNTADFMTRHGLDRNDMDAIGSYRGGGAQSFNNYLRGIGGRPLEKGKYERFMGLFAEGGKMPVTKGGEVVYRGMPDIQPGRTWQEKGFSSTTVSESVAKGFARSARERDGAGRLVRMVMPPGVRYLPMGTGEEEVVFEPGLTMTPFGYDAFESGIKNVGTVDALVQKAIWHEGA